MQFTAWCNRHNVMPLILKTIQRMQHETTRFFNAPWCSPRDFSGTCSSLKPSLKKYGQWLIGDNIAHFLRVFIRALSYSWKSCHSVPSPYRRLCAFSFPSRTTLLLLCESDTRPTNKSSTKRLSTYRPCLYLFFDDCAFLSAISRK